MALSHRARVRFLFLFAAFKSAARDIRRGFLLKPIAGGAPEGDPDPDPKDPDPKDPDPKDPSDPDPKDPDPVDPADDWKVKSRKNETRAKKAEKEAKETREKLEAREKEGKTESEKAVEKAKEEGRKEAETSAEKDRKADRLEVAVTRVAAKKIKVGSGDDAKEVRFADPEDAQLHIERAISRGEIDEDEIFNKEGRVESDALQKELVELLERKPHLIDGGAEGTPKPTGDPDLRKGDPADGDLEKMTPAEHAERKYGKSK